MGPETEESCCFYCTTLNFERKLPKRALGADRRALRRDTSQSFWAIFKAPDIIMFKFEKYQKKKIQKEKSHPYVFMSGNLGRCK